MKLIHHALIALTCTTTITGLLTSPAKAVSGCSVATRDKSSLSVYDSPNGELINALRFGRKVDIKGSAKDDQGRVWVKIAGDYDGEYRQWGWVIRRYLDCGNQASKKIVTVYGVPACSHTVKMIEELAQNGVPYIFKDIRYPNHKKEWYQRTTKAGVEQNAVPTVYINKNQWVKVGPTTDEVISQYRRN